jgi:DNA-binding MurR/RpiR family transcriptional regulator
MIFGTGGSMNVAQDALHKFMKVGLLVHVYEDIDLQLMAASLMREGDVALAISHSGGNLRTLRCLELAKEGGAFAIALTGLGKNPIAKAADVTVHIASEKTVYQSESVSTRIAQLAVIDTLAAMVAFDDYERSNEAMTSTREATAYAKF